MCVCLSTPFNLHTPQTLFSQAWLLMLDDEPPAARGSAVGRLKVLHVCVYWPHSEASWDQQYNANVLNMICGSSVCLHIHLHCMKICQPGCESIKCSLALMCKRCMSQFWCSPSACMRVLRNESSYLSLQANMNWSDFSFCFFWELISVIIPSVKSKGRKIDCNILSKCRINENKQALPQVGTANHGYLKRVNP